MKKLKSRFIKLSTEERLYHYDRPIVALTGGIATGKSTVSKLFEQRGLKIIDADQLVKSIYQTQEARDYIKTNFPSAWEQEQISFPKLRELFFHDPKIKKAIESFIYARLPKAFKEATDLIKDQGFYLYDVPLLFERNLDTKVDLSIVVYAPRNIQLNRLIDRDKVTEETAQRILDAQMDIEEKKDRSDLILNNMGTMSELAAEVNQLLLQILD
ncbi:MAG: dephospho-CoA kinase [Bacteriovoracaceae bacterium]|nr:dephospho-CoA kinase [Bacteriovoracaceae bacterium]